MVAWQGGPLDVNNLERLELIPLMWQSGYLTIRDYDPASRRYKLNFPNQEVHEAFFQTLVKEFAGLNITIVEHVASSCKRYLEQREFAQFIESVRSLFARIPNTLFKQESEASYHVVFLVILEMMGMKVQAELQTNVGRMDLVVETQDCNYVIELKFNKNFAVALEQIEQKDYAQRYAIEQKDLILMGINFSSKERNISDCKVITCYKDGSKSEPIDISA